MSFETLLSALTILAVLGCGIIGGVFFAFSTFIMNAFSERPPAEGAAAMQSINVVILRSLFIPVFIGTALLCLVLAVLAVIWWQSPRSLLLIGASGQYVLGSFGVTVLFNVPLNNQLAADGSAEVWQRYLSVWTGWNHIRTAASLLAAVLFMIALLYPGG